LGLVVCGVIGGGGDGGGGDGGGGLGGGKGVDGGSIPQRQILSGLSLQVAVEFISVLKK
jgi:hypothetical protein